ncbi:MAG: hypothetical protein BGO07_00250 [Alphaproteobacteria bacterium 40-19]|nr:MAG: hypothetical protein BGO07_00250 [Alphaproteobacteria bacterium 40-19]
MKKLQYFFFLFFSSDAFGYHQHLLSKEVIPRVLSRESQKETHFQNQDGLCAGFVHFWIKEQMQGGKRFERLKELFNSVIEYDVGLDKYILHTDTPDCPKGSSSLMKGDEAVEVMEEVERLQKKFQTLKYCPQRTQTVKKIHLLKKWRKLLLSKKRGKTNANAYWAVSMAHTKGFGHMVGISIDPFDNWHFYDPNDGVKKISGIDELLACLKSVKQFLDLKLKSGDHKKGKYLLSVKRVTEKDFKDKPKGKKGITNPVHSNIFFVP